MTTRTGGLAVLISTLLLMTACGSSGQSGTAQRLERRLETQMAPDIAAHRATVQSLPDGARVTLLDATLFPNNADTLDNRISDPRANIVEALLDPSLLRIQVADSSTLPVNQRDTRVRNVTEYLQVAGLGASVEPTEPAQAMPSGPVTSVPAGLAVTLTVQCPHRTSRTAYDNGESQPVCD
jgi:hypothetical protein